jgi:hypothetical protein
MDYVRIGSPEGSEVNVLGFAANFAAKCERAAHAWEAVQPEQYHEKPPLLCGYYSYWSGLPMDGRFENYIRPNRGWAALPTHDDLTLVVAGWPFADFAKNKTDVEGNYLSTFALAPEFDDRIHSAHREARVIGTAAPG